MYKLVIEHFFVTEDKNQRGNTIRDLIGATEGIEIKSKANFNADRTVDVIANSPKHLTSANDSIIDIDTLSTLTSTEIITNEAIPPNEEKTGK